MPAIKLTVQNQVGLHARPAAMFVQTARQFASEIHLAKGEKSANAKNILDVLTMGVARNEEITIDAEGEDATPALAALQSLIQGNFGEPIAPPAEAPTSEQSKT